VPQDIRVDDYSALIVAPMAVLSPTGKLALFPVFAKIVAALTFFGFDPMFDILHLFCVARSEVRVFLSVDSSRR
jgi:hypothetical protein